MTSGNKIKTFSELETYVQGLKDGDAFTVSDEEVKPLLTDKLTSLLGLDAITVSFVRSIVGATDITVTGTGEIMSMAGSTITLTFTKVTGNSDEMTLTIAIAPTAAESIPLIGRSSLSGGTITFKPDTNLKVYFIDLDCDITIGGSKIPVFVDIPAYPEPGYWVIGTGEIKDGMTITAELFKALSNDLDITTNLPSAINDLKNFTLNEIELSFNPAKPSFAFAYFSMTFTDGWNVLEPIGIDKGATLTLDFNIDFSGSGNSYAELIADFVIEESVPVELSAHLAKGNFHVWGQLQKGKTVSINTLFTKMGVTLPQGFPKVDVDSLGLQVDITRKSFTFDMSLDLSNAGVLTMGKMSSSMTVINSIPSGNFTGTLFIDKTTTLFLSADYAKDGLSLKGKEKNIKIDCIVKYLEKNLGISIVPAPIKKLELQLLTATYDTYSSAFTFDCKGIFTLTDKRIGVSIAITLTKVNKKYKATFSGKLIIGTSDFDLSFSTKHTDTWFAASWKTTVQSDYLEFKEIATAFGFTLPDIPKGLDLALKSATFTYDFTNEILILKASSASYGNAIFVAFKNRNSKWQFFFGLTVGASINLSNLPLINKELPGDETIEIDTIQVFIASAPLSQAEAKEINHINQADPGYPKIPTQGLPNEVTISTNFDFGGHVIPLSIGAGGGQSPQKQKTGTQLPAPQAQKDSAIGMPSGMNAGTVSQPTQSTDPNASPDNVHWFPLQKALGPVYFDKVGAQFQGDTLSFLLDASLTVAGLNISLDGAKFGSPLNKFVPKFGLDGMGIAYQNGPMEIGAAFLTEHVAGPPPYDEYDGTALLKTEALSLSAIGSYANYQGHMSLFVYGVLDYPIGGPSYFFVTGLAAGFGYNRSVKMPAIDQVAQFPLVEQAVGTTNAPTDISSVLDSLSTDIPLDIGEYFLAAGIKFTSFGMINSFALLSVSFGQRLEVDVLGLSTLIVPTPVDGKQPPEILAELQMALKATFIPEEGFLGVQAQLTPASFILTPDCHVTGGFAFYCWFNDSPAGAKAGEFVVSMGGYAPAFTPPSYYPSVPRLGVNWQFDGNLSIKGDSYYALTPTMLMAGGLRQATWQSGDLKAWFTVSADFLIGWQPYHYDAQMQMGIGVAYTLDLLFGSHTFTYDVSADLHIWGPKFCGTAHIDIHVISFDMSFGDISASPSPATIDWNSFKQNFLPKDDSVVCGISVKSGLVRKFENNGVPQWIINPKEFSVVTNSVIPSKALCLNEALIVGDEYLFSFTPAKNVLIPLPSAKQTTVPKQLSGIFKSKNILLSKNATFSLSNAASEWTISDQGKTYSIIVPLQTNGSYKVWMLVMDNRTNTTFGVKAMGVQTGDFYSTHTVSVLCQNVLNNDVFQFNPIWKNVPSALWDGSGSPAANLKDLPMIENTLAGFEIKASPPNTGYSLKICSQNLAFEIFTPKNPCYYWEQRVTFNPSKDQSKDKISPNDNASHRQLLLKALNMDEAIIDLTGFNPDIFIDSPKIGSWSQLK